MAKSTKTTSGANKTPGDVDDDDKTAPVTKGELDKAANRGAETKKRPGEPNRKPLKEGEHPGADFRSRVENSPAGDLNMDPREPYPTGNPPDPEQEHFRNHGGGPGPNVKGDD